MADQDVQLDEYEEMTLKGFMLRAVLWLPLCFFFWFIWSGLWVQPVYLLCKWLLPFLFPDSFFGVAQQQYHLLIEAYIQELAPNGRVGVAEFAVNPMIYGYGLPLLAGLSICSPNTIGKRAIQILIGYALICLVQTWGVIWESLKEVGLKQIAGGEYAYPPLELSSELIALCYQLGYLIFPAIVPIFAWIVMNRKFVESLVGRARLADLSARET